MGISLSVWHMAIPMMIGMMISVGTNIILDPFLMFGFHLCIRGAAIATVFAGFEISKKLFFI